MTTTISKHFCLDGYRGSPILLADAKRISRLLNQVGTKFFATVSYQQCTIPCFGNSNPKLDGISGFVLGYDSHFTVHTFSNAGIAFVDYYGKSAEAAAKVIPDLVKEYLGPIFVMSCGADLRPGYFGRHLIFNSQPIDYLAALALVGQIVDAVDMIPLGPSFENVLRSNEYSIIQPITESHISIHAIQGRPTKIDIFSCKYFDSTGLAELIDGELIQEVQRGVRLSPNWRD